MPSLLLVPFLATLFARVTWSFIRMFGLFVRTVETPVLSSVFAGLTLLSWVASFSTPLTQLKNQYFFRPSFTAYEQVFRHVAQRSPLAAEQILNNQTGLSPAQHHTLSFDANEGSALQDEVIVWENALKLQPTDRDVLLNLYELYTRTNQPLKAQQALTKAKEIDPNYDYGQTTKSLGF